MTQSWFQMPVGIEIPAPNSFGAASSSFPSGHAAVLGAFSAALLLVSLPVGIFALVYSILICLLRVFFGMDYATDLLAGGPMGILTFYLSRSNFLNKKLTSPILGFSENRPALFYAAFFLISYGVATGFSESRSIIHLLKHL
jgi:undecaprenyl-diphosphatase